MVPPSIAGCRGGIGGSDLVIGLEIGSLLIAEEKTMKSDKLNDSPVESTSSATPSRSPLPIVLVLSVWSVMNPSMLSMS